MENPVPVSKMNPAIGPMLSDLIERLLAKNPEDRPESWDEILVELEKINDKERKIVKKGSAWPCCFFSLPISENYPNALTIKIYGFV